MTNIPKTIKDKFVAECDVKLPQAALDKKLSSALAAIVANYPDFQQGTARTVLKEYGRSYKPAPQIKVIKNKRLTDAEKRMILSSFETNNWGPSEQVKNQILGERTPTKACISRILTRQSQKYRSNVSTTKVSPATEQSIISHFKGGAGTQDIITALQASGTPLSRVTVETVLAKSGFDITRGKTAEEKETIYNTYHKYGINQTPFILEAVGIEASPTTIRRIVNEFGGPKRDNSNSYRKYSLDQKVFEKIDTEPKAYALGSIGSDGSVNGRNLYMEIMRSDEGQLVKLGGVFGTNKPIEKTVHYHKQYNKYYLASRLTICSSKIISDS